MNYPLISEYIDAILSSEDNFASLTNLNPVLDKDGSPIMSSGNFAVVFKMKDKTTGKLYAVKCFTKEQDGRNKSYKLISDELKNVASTYLTPIRYLENELFVDTQSCNENEFPVLLMDWVDGLCLDDYVKSIIDDKYKREKLAFDFQQFVRWLLAKPFAHGDLKPDNIIVKDDGSIVIIDYDGMFVPAMQGQKAKELGTPVFQYKCRTLDNFDEFLDDYAAILLLLILKVISIKPSNFDQYLLQDTKDIIRQFDTFIDDKRIAPLLSAFIMVATFGKIERQMLTDFLADYSSFDFTIENKLLKSAQKGDTVAMVSLGNLYREGINVPKNYSKAIQWYGLARILGNVNAYCGLCNCYRNGYDFGNIIEVLFNENVDFAICHKGSELIDKDLSKAKEILSKGYEMNYAPAIELLGNCYKKEENHKLSIKYYQESANLGLAHAQDNLGDYYYYGQGVNQDYAQAAIWFRKAAEQGNADAQYNLGNRYKNGQGVNQDYAQAVIWYRKAAEQGNSDAQINLGFCYYIGQGVNQDYDQAAIWFRKAAEQGNVDAQYILGVCYYIGQGVNQDYDQAVIWYRKAAEKGNAYAQNNLGNRYKNGQGVNQDYDQAAIWFRKAAEQGNSLAEYLFEQCCKLYEINNPANVDDSEISCIGECNTGTYSTDEKRFLRYWGTYGEEYEVKEGTEILCDESFNDLYSECDGHYLETLYLPSTLKRIGNNVFCVSLTSIVCKSKKFISENGFLLSANRTTLYRYFGNETNVYIPKGIIYIKGGAFSEKNIEKVIIPESVMIIGDNPFAGCWKLIELTSNSKKFQVIDNTLYDLNEKRLIGCWNYKASHIYIESDTKIIGKNAFFGSIIQTIKIPNSVDYIDETTFYHCFNLNTIYVPKGRKYKFSKIIPIHYSNLMVEESL